MSKRKKLSFGERVTEVSAFHARIGQQWWNLDDPETGIKMAHQPIPDELARRLQDCFKPVSLDEAMDRFFYEELRKPKHVSGTNQFILNRAKHSHPEWPCPGSIQGMRKRAQEYQEGRQLDPIQPRNHKRK